MAQDLASDNPAPAPSPSPAPRPTVIEARPSWRLLDVGDLWRHRELLWILAMRALKMRYKQTVVGALWAVIQPVIVMVVFSVLFKAMGRTPTSDEYPYAVMLYAGLLPWQLFAEALRMSSESLVTNQRLITKVYFPRVIVVLAPILTALVDFAIAFGVLLGLMVWYGVTPTWGVLLLPLLVGLAMTIAFAAGIWFAALNALYRDVRYVVPSLIQVGMFVSPVIYDTQTVVSSDWALLYSLNPMAGVIEGFRWAILGTDAPPLVPMGMALGVTLVVLLSGLAYFRHVERTIADRV